MYTLPSNPKDFNFSFRRSKIHTRINRPMVACQTALMSHNKMMEVVP